MDPQLKRGFGEACVLATLARGDSYGYQIVKDSPPSMQLTESTLYSVLRRLAKQGLLDEYTREHSGRLRKYYHLTDEGRAQLEDFAAGTEDIADVISYVKGSVEQ